MGTAKLQSIMRRFGPTSAAVVLAALVLAATLASAWLSRPGDRTRGVAEALQGERTFVLRARQVPVGHFTSDAYRGPGGDYVFATTMEYASAANTRTRVRDEFVFAAAPPHALLRASHRQQVDDRDIRSVAINGNHADIFDGAERRTVAFGASFALADHVGLEQWLAAQPRAEGERFVARSLDFERLLVLPVAWRVAGTGRGGLSMIKESRRNQAVMHLDANFAPLRLDIAGRFVMERISKVELDAELNNVAMHGADPFESLAVHIPIDRPLGRHKDLRRLVVGIEHSPGAFDEDIPGGDASDIAESWPHIDWSAGEPRLVVDAQKRSPVGDDGIRDATLDTLTYPASSPRFRALAERAVGGLIEPLEQARALTGFVHDYLRYQEQPEIGTVHDTLRRKTGDCSEYADLFTTLARAVDLPARTVVGLAYNAETHGFSPHAWNEVAIDGWWHGFDPTWGQTELDATHFVLPDAVSAHRAGMSAGVPGLRFRLIEAVY